ncbi:MAG: amidohydrolase, partial [Pseudomonadota bacterium]
MTLRYVLSLLAALVCVTSSIADEHEKDWSVDEPSYSVDAKTVEINTDQGTWMSLDVSPDGKTVVFDLLGDLYTIPISGGNAQKLSSGHAWDMQPRYSPNGQQIAFTSDRAGGDNIWVMNSDGSDARAISSEKFRLLNNPSWSPDGRYLAARKHFTTARSLGTGEIWLYDLRGGNGLQVVKRPGERFQKELGEPMFSPDGKSIYYSQNITSGDTFIYAQDSNTELFRIRRVELDSGEIEDIAGGPGGAARPAPSPDGQHLAYVKRVRAKSRLFVMDLNTGAERMLVDSLDQDMQETWAVHGVYPNMDWLPDSSALVFWRNGGIYRVELSSGNLSQIPFSIEDTRSVYEAPVIQIDVAPEQFETKMVRWAQKVGDQLVFESLGRLYSKPAGSDQAPRRLTRDDNASFETYPVASRDGRWIYFIAWSDQTLGSIRRVSARGGKSSTVTDTTGHYRELAISPNGRKLAYRLGSGGALLKPMAPNARGIYVMDIRSGESQRISKSGSNPHFAADNDHLYVQRSHSAGGQSKTKLTRLSLTDKDERDIASFPLAREIKMAPDGRHLAFIEGYQVHVAPIPASGQMISLSPSANNVPVKRASKTGGEYLDWQDANTIAWSLGPQYKSAELDALYGDEYEAPVAGTSLSVKAELAKPEGVLALTNARVITMNADEIIDGATILIESNRIKAIGADVSVPAGTKTLDMEGKTIVPGFIDIHGHGPYGQDLIVPQQNWSGLAHLALGVTTLHNPSSRSSLVFPAAEYSNAGLILGPRLFSTGEIVYGAKASVFAPVNSLEDALAHIRRLKAQGAISVKNYNQPRRDQRQQVVEAARMEDMMVVAEGGSLYHMDINMVVDGNTGIEHTLPQMAIYDDVLQLWGQTNVGYTPTLVVGYGTIFGEDYWYQESEVWKHPLLSA